MKSLKEEEEKEEAEERFDAEGGDAKIAGKATMGTKSGDGNAETQA